MKSKSKTPLHNKRKPIRIKSGTLRRLRAKKLHSVIALLIKIFRRDERRMTL